MQATYLGGNDSYVTGRKYVYSDDSTFDFDGNWARYDFATSAWSYITDVPKDSVNTIVVIPSPTSNLVAYKREVRNADQLHLDAERRLRRAADHTLGWDEPPLASRRFGFLFIRDVHRGEGSHWIPFAYDLATGEERGPWPALPDSVPVFPPLPPPGTSPTFK